MSRAVEDVVFLLVIIIGLAFLLSVIPATRELGRRHRLKARKRRNKRLLALEHASEEFKRELQQEIDDLDRQLRKDT